MPKSQESNQKATAAKKAISQLSQAVGGHWNMLALMDEEIAADRDDIAYWKRNGVPEILAPTFCSIVNKHSKDRRWTPNELV